MSRVLRHGLHGIGFVVVALLTGTCSKSVTDDIPDTTPPAPIQSFFFYQTLPTEVELGWVAPSDDRSDSVQQYDCRFSLDSITRANWDDAGYVTDLPKPSHSGAYERVLFSGLDSLTTYYFAIRAVDKAGNYSAISHILKKLALPLDTLPPLPITDLHFSAIDTFSLQLAWSAPNERDSSSAARYEIRYDTMTITEKNWSHATLATSPPIPGLPGNQESYLLSGLSAGATYYCAIRSADQLGHMSYLSNIVSANTFDTVVVDTVPTDTIPTDTTPTDTLRIITATEFGTGSYIVPKAVAINSPTEYIVAGSIGLYPCDNYLAKLTDSGSVVWEKSFGNGTDESLTDVAVTTDQVIAAVGYEGGHVIIRWINQTGQIMEILTLDTTNAVGNPFYPPQVVAAPDGGIAVLYESSQELGNGNGITSVPRIAKYNVLGEEEWNQYQIAGSSCPTSDGGHSNPTAGMGKLGILDTLIIFSWVAEWQDRSSLWCGPYLDGSYISTFGIGGDLLHATAIQEIYDGTPLTAAGIMVSPETASSDKFAAVEMEPYVLTIAQFDGQGSKIDAHTNVLTISPSILGGATISSDRYLIYGSSYSDSKSTLFAAVIDQLGNIHTQLMLPDSAATTANDAVVLSNDTFLLIGGITATDGSAAKGLFVKLKYR